MSVAVCSREARAPRPRRIFQAGARLGLAALVGVAVASIDVPARAETSAEVNVIFKRGVEAYKEADFRAAAAEFRRAYEASKHDYRVLYNIAQCEYQLTNYVGALAAFERFLADGGGKVKDDKRGEVAGEIAKLKARIATLTVQLTPATAQLSIDGEAVKADEPIKLNPGGHKLEATAPGFQRGLAQVDVTGGDARTVTLALVAVPPPKPVVVVAPPREPPRPVSWTAPVVGYAVTGGLAAGTIVFAVLTQGKATDLADEKRLATADPARLKSLDSGVGTSALVTDIFLGATLVAAGVSVYLTVRALGAAEPRKTGEAGNPGKTGEALPAVRVAPTLGGAMLMGSFQ
ncbi:MAG: hypothetical protein IPF92_02425 [Myxococcales bacterium]|nr:hypothetical protein [Myxococcales bacterium]MBL0193984.1 hypothetical protein [Myxococcales bacterium]